MTRKTLTPKQEEFCRIYIETSNATESYRRAYNPPNANYTSIKRRGHVTLNRPLVQARIKELQAGHAERHDMSVDDIAEMLKEDRLLARKQKQAGAAVAATMGMAKLYGLITDKVKSETTIKGDADDYTDDELAAIAARGRGSDPAPPESPPDTSRLH